MSSNVRDLYEKPRRKHFAEIIKEDRWEATHGLGSEALHCKGVVPPQFSKCKVIPVGVLSREHDRGIIFDT